MGLFDKLFGRKTASQGTPAQAPGDTTSAGDAWSDSSGVPQEFAASEVRELLRSSEPPQLVDVREAHERQNDGHLPGDMHIPMDQLESRAAELDPQRPVVVYCASGMRSMECGAWLLEHGFREVINLNGGLNGWSYEKMEP